MANDRFKRYLWLVDKLSMHEGMSFNELDRLWRNSGLNPGREPLPRRTLYNHIEAIKEIFEIDIKNNRSRGFYIDEQNGGPNEYMSWMMSCMSVNSISVEYKDLRDRILPEPAPKGQKFLNLIMEAMQSGKTVLISYRKNFKGDLQHHEVRPYCVKLFKGRWYMLSYNPARMGLRTYALDRVGELSVTGNSYTLPPEFCPAEVFSNFYGVTIVSGEKPQRVVIRAFGSCPDYLRSRPLHHSQREEGPIEDGSSKFSYRIVDSYELRQELLSYGPDIEVLEPKSLREEMTALAGKMAKLYKVSEE